MTITLTFIDPTDGETLEVEVTRPEVTAAIEWHDLDGWELFENEKEIRQ